MLGGSGPRAQIRVNIIINGVTGFVSALLLGFLIGHYDALRDLTGEAPPRIIHLVYAFLGLVLVWQLLGLIINTGFKRKLYGGRKAKLTAGRGGGESGLPARPTERALPAGGVRYGGKDSRRRVSDPSTDDVPSGTEMYSCWLLR